MKQQKRQPVCILAAALALLLISCIGASLVQTNFGHVTVKDLRWETPSGHMLSALLLVPDNATEEHPAPAIVCSHGWLNNREMQDLNYVEYARRGFVVLSIDMYGHGNSEDLPENTWWLPEHHANGMYDAVQLMASLPYVDAGRIGVTGHSNGALASRTAVLLDNEAETPLIAAALLVSNDAVYQDRETGDYINIFRGRDAGIVACQYDEFFHRVRQPDGSISPPREYLRQHTAQSFLYFGRYPANEVPRSAETMYRETIDGEEAIRVIYNPSIIHPWAHFSAGVVANSVSFFDAALQAPNPIPGGDQIWQWKTVFNTVGIAGFFTFLVGFVLCLLESRFFGELKAEMVPGPAVLETAQERRRLWLGLAAGVAFSAVMYVAANVLGRQYRPAFFRQMAPFNIALWSALCGLFTLGSMCLTCRVWKRAGNPMDLEAAGIRLSGKKLAKTALLGTLAAVSAYGTVFAADYFFQTDFRIWCFTLKAFSLNRAVEAMKYLPMFLLFYMANSAANNCFHNVQMGKKSWGNTAVLVLCNALSSLLLITWMYGTFFVTGFHPLEQVGGGIIGIWLFPVVIVLAVFALLSRILYNATRNPYLPGIAMAIIVALMSSSNTITFG